MIALGVIPARGGSKGVPGKNIRPVAGVPLVVHTIRAAGRSELLDRFVVSTDSPEIATVARAAGAEVVERPAELAGDESPTEDALLHAVDALGVEPRFVVTLEPTSPLRRAETIDACIAKALELDADSVMTVAPTTDVLGVVEDGLFVPLDPAQPRRRQLRRSLYRESSTVYVTALSHLRQTRLVVAPRTHAVAITAEEAIDVNTEADLAAADALVRVLAGTHGYS